MKTYQWSSEGRNPQNNMLRIFWISPCDLGFDAGNRMYCGMNDFDSQAEAERARDLWEATHGDGSANANGGAFPAATC